MMNLRTALRQPSGVNARGGAFTIGHFDSIESWGLLEPQWQPILAETPNATVFQTYPYLRTWWDCLGAASRLLIIVVLREDSPIAIAPLQISSVRQLGMPVRTVSFIGQPSESDRPTLLGAVNKEAACAVADYLMEIRTLWDSIQLFEQPADSELLHALRDRLRRAGYLVRKIDGNECPYIAITGSWNEYLATRTKAFRKSLKRRRAQLTALGRVELETVDANAAMSALERYRAVEDRSWKRAKNLGIARSPRHWNFYCELGAHDGLSNWLRFRFLKLNGRDIAATFGFLWRGRFYSLHVAHDAAYSSASPGVVLTALELETVFAQGECRDFDFLGGFLTNKRGWASGSQRTTALFGDRPRWRAHAFHFAFFRIKPIARRLLAEAGVLERVTQVLRQIRRSRKQPVES